MERLRVAIQKAREARGTPGAGLAGAQPGSRRASTAWDQMDAFAPDQTRLARHRIVTLDRVDPAFQTFDMLRTRVLTFLRDKNMRTVGVTSPTAGCGKTTVALNLAFSLARQDDVRTVVVDLDLRRPTMAKCLGVSGWTGFDEYLEGNASAERTLRRFRDNLAIAVNGGGRANPAELLQSKQAADAMRTLHRELKPDVMLVDLPPLVSCDDVWAFLPNLDCILLVASADHSTFEELDTAERALSERTTLLGVVLNRCRTEDEVYTNY